MDSTDHVETKETSQEADTQKDDDMSGLGEEMDVITDDDTSQSDFEYVRLRGTSTDILASEHFQLDLPFDEFKCFVEKEKELFFSYLEDGDDKPRFEHVGSTSIKGMPGMPIPDALILEKCVPPSRSTVKALLHSGWKAVSLVPQKTQDLWFFKHYEGEPLCKRMVVHVTCEENKMAQLQLMTRDRCNNDPIAFEDYKTAKILAALGEAKNSFAEYKRLRGQCDFLKGLRKEVGLDENVVTSMNEL